MTDAENHVRISIALHKDDAARLLAAFKEGRLADLNIVDIIFPDGEDKQPIGKWTSQESRSQVAPDTKKRGGGI